MVESQAPENTQESKEPLVPLPDVATDDHELQSQINTIEWSKIFQKQEKVKDIPALNLGIIG